MLVRIITEVNLLNIIITCLYVKMGKGFQILQKWLKGIIRGFINEVKREVTCMEWTWIVVAACLFMLAYFVYLAIAD